jgi:hypothetical protein
MGCLSCLNKKIVPVYFYPKHVLTWSTVQSLPLEKRRHVKHIVVDEDAESVVNPESHGHALIPLCKENPDLFIERRVGLLRNIFPRWQPEYIEGRYWNRETFMDEMLLWIQEAQTLFMYGMPSGRFELMLDFTTPGSIEGWQTMKRAAALHDAMIQWYSQPGKPVLHLTGPGSMHEWRFASRFRLPLDLPSDFSKVIQEIIQGESFIRLLGKPGQIWDRDLLFYETKDRTVAEWEEDWHKRVLDFWPSCSIPTSVRRKHHLDRVARTTRIVRNGRVVKESTVAEFWRDE